MTKNSRTRAIGVLTVKNNDIGYPNEHQEIIRQFVESNSLDMLGLFAIRYDDAYASIEHALNFAQSKETGIVLIDDTKRLQLTNEELISFLDYLISSQIELAFCKDDVRFNNAALVAIRNLLNGSKMAHSALLSEKIKRGLRKKRLISRPHRSAFGLNQEEKAVIEQILHLSEEGYSLQKICNALTISDCKTVNHKKWHPTTIKRIIERAKKQESIYPQ